MKLLFAILAIFMLNKDCEQNKASELTIGRDNSEKTSHDMSQEIKTIWYEASTRGFYERIWVSKDSTTITMDRNHVSKMTYPTSEGDWNELMEKLNKVKVNELPNLEAPTSMRQYDGAAFATLGVVEGKSETTSNSFDHGHPPKAIEAVVNKVLSIKASHEKN
ncbi:hypothetical protein M0G43_02125 [Subsaxibacter sp. CAU 1640]|uniref:hypothetical protein n=1 Tax=Subsaxibacter sp. CAU 1640 TaxID=2933271 RepID=UPI00200634F0|nr:hypothetical protein [Subsaxibacter sp. CAU 1640]MCK7589362.1 hypothetical protein [Subsaxibacter sp. CAU 1640]